MDTAPRLVCEQYKHREIRCNKDSPCSACKNAGINCHTVQCARLSCGKSGKGRNTKLEDRVTRIERLLAQQAGFSSASCTAANGESVEKVDTNAVDPALGTRLPNFVASDFWIALSEEIHGLRETLENPRDEAEDEEQASVFVLAHPNTMSNTGAFLFPFANRDLPTDPSLIPSDNLSKLLELYRYRVDSVYKILHWPTVLRMIQQGQESNSTTSPELSENCLKAAIYFMAICSITDSESVELGFGNRREVLQRYRSTLENSLSRSSLLQCPDLKTVQAFVIYLIGLRTCLSGAYTWTLIAIATRAATALRLGEENIDTHSLFDIQLRRRLLFAIGILDTHSALDRGTIPILPSTAFGTPPLNINDEDMSTLNRVPTSSPLGHTDISHSIMTYEAMLCQRRMYEISQACEDVSSQWLKKLELIDAFEKGLQSIKTSIGRNQTPLEKLHEMSGSKILISLQLLLRRPPYKQARSCVPPWDDFNVLEAATNVLEQHLRPVTPELRPWAWKNWVQWHALAVVLAELTIHPEGPQSDRAYSIATRSFQYYSQIVADSESGMLWRPIAKLMRRVRSMRQSAGLHSLPYFSHVSDPGQLPAEQRNDKNDQWLAPATDIIGLGSLTFDNDGSTDHNLMFADEGGLQDEDGMPWLGWDSFLNDMNLANIQ